MGNMEIMFQGEIIGNIDGFTDMQLNGKPILFVFKGSELVYAKDEMIEDAPVPNVRIEG